MKIEVKSFKDLSVQELYEILQLRSEVFVVEQNCVYNDIDGIDQEALHVLALDDDRHVIGYTRLLKSGTRFNKASIGRMVVSKKQRFKGYAGDIMKRSIEYIFNEWNETTIHISAQQYLKGFYSSLGFEIVTDPYLEDGIPHVGMDIQRN